MAWKFNGVTYLDVINLHLSTRGAVVSCERRGDSSGRKESEAVMGDGC
jgi:hypothetical protein